MHTQLDGDGGCSFCKHSLMMGMAVTERRKAEHAGGWVLLFSYSCRVLLETGAIRMPGLGRGVGVG